MRTERAQAEQGDGSCLPSAVGALVAAMLGMLFLLGGCGVPTEGEVISKRSAEPGRYELLLQSDGGVSGWRRVNETAYDMCDVGERYTLIGNTGTC